jgi:hypothetical protein
MHDESSNAKAQPSVHPSVPPSTLYVTPTLRVIGDWSAVTLVGSSPFELPDSYLPGKRPTII